MQDVNFVCSKLGVDPTTLTSVQRTRIETAPDLSTALSVFTGNASASISSNIGLVVEKRFIEVTDKPQQGPNNKLREYADGHGAMFKGPDGLDYLKGSDDKIYQVMRQEKYEINTQWTSEADATKHTIENGKADTLDAIVAHYNQSLKEGERKITREDVVACNPEIFGSKGCEERGTSIDGVANLRAGDKDKSGDILIIPVLSEKSAPPLKVVNPATEKIEVSIPSTGDNYATSLIHTATGLTKLEVEWLNEHNAGSDNLFVRLSGLKPDKDGNVEIELKDGTKEILNLKGFIKEAQNPTPEGWAHGDNYFDTNIRPFIKPYEDK